MASSTSGPDRSEGARPPADARAGKRGTYRAGFFFGSLSFLGTALLGLVSTIVTARIYGVDTIGEFTLATAPAGILFVLSTVKEQQALIKEITGLQPRHPRVTELFSAVFFFSAGLTLAVAAADIVVCWFVFHGPLHRPDLFMPAAVSVANYAIFTNTGWNIDSVFSAFVAGRELFWVRLFEALSFLLIAIAIGVFWQSVWSLIAATIASTIVALMVRAVWVGRYVRRRIGWGEFRGGLSVLPEMLPFGLRATPGQMAQGIMQQAGVWALGIVASTSVVGAYSRAVSIPQRLQQASLRVTEVLYPTLVGRHTSGDRRGFERALVDSIRYEVVGMLLLAAVIGGAAHSVLNIFGPGFNKAAPALALLMIFPALAAITVGQTQALWAVNRPGLTSMVSIARMVISIVLLVILTPSIGIVGPPIALLAGYASGVVFAGLALRGHLSQGIRITWPLRERFALMVAYGAGFGTSHALEHLIPTALGALLALAAGSLAYPLAFVAAGGLNPRDSARLRHLRAWVEPRLPRRTRRPQAQPREAPAEAAGFRPPNWAWVLLGVVTFLLAYKLVPEKFEGSWRLVTPILIVAGVLAIRRLWDAPPAVSMCAALALSIFSGAWSQMGLGNLPLNRLLAVLVIAQCLLRAPGTIGMPRLQLRNVHLMMGLTLLYAIGSAVAAGTFTVEQDFLALWDTLGLMPYLLFLVAPSVFAGERERRWLLYTLLGLGTYLGITAFFEILGPHSLVFPRYITASDAATPGVLRAGGPFQSAVAEGCATFVCAVAAAIAFGSWEGRLRWLAGAAGLISLMGCFLSLERGVWLAAAIATIVASLATRSGRRLLIPGLLAAAIVIGGALSASSTLSHSTNERATDERSVWDRENMFSAGLRMVDDKPLFGFGWGRYETDNREFFRQAPTYPMTGIIAGSLIGVKEPPQPLHSTYLALAVELGLFGLALWLATLLWAVGEGIFRRGPAAMRPWKQGLIAVAVFVLVVIAVNPREPPFAFVIILAWAGVALAGTVPRRGLSPRPVPSGELSSSRPAPEASVA
jgi:putative inorganic carbon (hco3(-)) transporter